MATKQTKKKAAYTVFDTIYRTMVQKYPQLVITPRLFKENATMHFLS